MEMTVEEARGNVHVVLARKNCTVEDIHEALDALVLAVKTEMPCYMKQQGAAYDCASWNALDDGTLTLNEHFRAVPLCPSCTARRGV